MVSMVGTRVMETRGYNLYVKLMNINRKSKETFLSHYILDTNRIKFSLNTATMI